MGSASVFVTYENVHDNFIKKLKAKPISGGESSTKLELCANYRAFMECGDNCILIFKLPEFDP